MTPTAAAAYVQAALSNLRLARFKLAAAIDDAETHDDRDRLGQLKPAVWKVDAAIAEVQKL